MELKGPAGLQELWSREGIHQRVRGIFLLQQDLQHQTASNFLHDLTSDLGQHPGYEKLFLEFFWMTNPSTPFLSQLFLIFILGNFLVKSLLQKPDEARRPKI